MATCWPHPIARKDKVVDTGGPHVLDLAGPGRGVSGWGQAQGRARKASLRGQAGLGRAGLGPEAGPGRGSGRGGGGGGAAQYCETQEKTKLFFFLKK